MCKICAYFRNCRGFSPVVDSKEFLFTSNFEKKLIFQYKENFWCIQSKISNIFTAKTTESSQNQPNHFNESNRFFFLNDFHLLVEASSLGLAFSLCCFATACCALLRLMYPSFARLRISSSTDRFTFLDTTCLSFCCSVNCCFFAWIGASVLEFEEKFQVNVEISNVFKILLSKCLRKKTLEDKKHLKTNFFNVFTPDKLASKLHTHLIVA